MQQDAAFAFADAQTRRSVRAVTWTPGHPPARDLSRTIEADEEIRKGHAGPHSTIGNAARVRFFIASLALPVLWCGMPSTRGAPLVRT